jgi:hypothetical protein
MLRLASLELSALRLASLELIALRLASLELSVLRLASLELSVALFMLIDKFFCGYRQSILAAYKALLCL